mgnify:FL=1
MTNINPNNTPSLAPLHAALCQLRAMQVMHRYRCYVVPGPDGWRVRNCHGYDMPWSWSLNRDDRGVFDTPEAALLAAGEYLERKERGE